MKVAQRNRRESVPMLPSMSSIVTRLRLRHLRLIIALAEHGTLIKAGDQVHMTQPGVTKALQEIEAALGVTLFVRSNKGLTPNQLGHCVVRYAHLILADLTHLREEMLGVMQGHGGRLAVGTIMGAVPLVTQALAEVLEQQPTLSIEVVEDTSAQLLRLLEEGRLEAAVCRTSVSQRPDAYRSWFIQNESLAVVAHQAHPLACAKSVGLVDLVSYRWVVYSANMPMRLLWEREFHSAGLPLPTGIVETTSAFTTLSFLQRDPTMVALLSNDVASFFEGFGITARLPLELQSRSEPYLLVMRNDREPSVSAKLLLTAMVAQPMVS